MDMPASGTARPGSGGGAHAAARLTEWLAIVPGLPASLESRLGRVAAGASLARLLDMVGAQPHWEQGWLAAIASCGAPGQRDGLRRLYHNLFRNPPNALAACRESLLRGDAESFSVWFRVLRSFCCAPQMLAMTAAREKEINKNAGRRDIARQYAAWLDGFGRFEKDVFRPYAAGVCELMREAGMSVRPRDDWAYNIWYYGCALPARELSLRDAWPDSGPGAPRFSILMPVYNPRPEHLVPALESVFAQSWPHWELCIADDASTDPRIAGLLSDYQARDVRMRVCRRPSNGHIAAASNTALGMARYEFAALMDQDDLLEPDALAVMARAIRLQPGGRLYYSDEDMIMDDSGALHGVNFKNGKWDLELLPQQNIAGHLSVYRTALMRRLGGFREGYPGSQDHDLLLRYAGSGDGADIVHVPHVLYHWRAHANSTASGIGNKAYAIDSSRRAAQDWLDSAWPGARMMKLDTCVWHRVVYPEPDREPEVDLVCVALGDPRSVADRIAALRPDEDGRCRLFLVCRQRDCDSLRNALPETERCRLLPVPDGSSREECLQHGASQGDGEIIGFLGDAVAPAGGNWLDEILSCLCRGGIGAVGGKLIRADGSLEHGGYLTDAAGELKPLLARGPARHIQWFGWNLLARTVDALDCSCLFTKREIFGASGGLDADMESWAGQDYCLRLASKGLKSVWWPFAEFRVDGTPQTDAAPPGFTARWLGRLEPFNRNLVIEEPNFALRTDPGR